MIKEEQFFTCIRQNMTMLLATSAGGNVSMRTVSPVVYGDGILIFTDSGSKKYRQMRENPHCCLSVDVFFAEATVRFCGATMLPENKVLREAYNRKFPGAFDEGIEFGGRKAEFLLLMPNRITGWAYADGSLVGDGIPTVPFEINRKERENTMPEIKRVYRQTMPRMKLVGKCYHEEDKQNNTFSAKWCEWFANNWFAPLSLPGTAEPFEDCNSYIGLCRCKEDEPFEYWIGVFLPIDFPVPEGYQSVELEAGDIGVAWIYGKEPDIYSYCCLSRLAEDGMQWTADRNGVSWCFERYVCPRFTEPDEQGNVILDMCYYIK